MRCLSKDKKRYFGLLPATAEGPGAVERRGTIGHAKSTAEVVAQVEEAGIGAACSHQPDYSPALQAAQALSAASSDERRETNTVGWLGRGQQHRGRRSGRTSGSKPHSRRTAAPSRFHELLVTLDPHRGKGVRPPGDFTRATVFSSSRIHNSGGASHLRNTCLGQPDPARYDKSGTGGTQATARKQGQQQRQEQQQHLQQQQQQQQTAAAAAQNTAGISAAGARGRGGLLDGRHTPGSASKWVLHTFPYRGAQQRPTSDQTRDRTEPDTDSDAYGDPTLRHQPLASSLEHTYTIAFRSVKPPVPATARASAK